VGVLIVETPDPHMDAFFEVESLMGAAQYAYIVISCFDQLEIIQDLI